MGTRLIGWTLVGLASAGGLSHATPGPDAVACVTGIQDGVPHFLPTRNESFVQAALADPPVPPGTRPPLPPGWRRPGEPPPPPRSIRVAEVFGPIADRIGPDSTVALVFWAIGDETVGCITVVNSPRFEADEYLIGGTLRPDSLWVDHRPTIDVFPTWFRLAQASKLEPGYTLDTVLEFIAALPSHGEWSVDCRPVTVRAERWLEGHPSGYQSARARMVADLRPTCRRWLAIHATGLRRGGGWSRSVPDMARQALVSAGCREDTNPRGQFPRWIVMGHFRDASTPEYASICHIDGTWRLLVVTMTPVMVVEELSRMVGSGAGWSLQSLPPEFFDWTSSGEFQQVFINQAPVARPKHDILLLMAPAQAYSVIQLAFFTTPQGWVQVGVECCNWPR